MQNKIIAVAALFGAAAVALGAFGAHGLKPLLTPEAAQTFETAVRYHFIHAIMALVAGILYQQTPTRQLLGLPTCSLPVLYCFQAPCIY